MQSAIVWCGRLALVLGLLALVVMLMQGPGYKMGWIDLMTVFGKVFRVVVIVGGIAALLGLISIVGVKVGGSKAMVMGLVGLLAGAAAASVPLGIRRTAQSLPPIHDITTDTASPPEFVAIVPLRADAPNPVSYDSAIAEKQLGAYPDVKTLQLDASTAEVFAAASEVITSMNWELVAADQPSGRIEATETTTWFGFKDDVVIRISESGGKTLVDVRSKSRIGMSDLGVNAKRIRVFRDQLLARVQ